MNSEQSRMYSIALQFAAQAHGAQVRKYTGEPYVLHPIEVAEFLRRYDMPIHTVVGGVLHDVVEDTDVTLNIVRSMFNDEVAEIVEGVTNVATDKSIPRAKRFWMNVEHLSNAPEQSQNVKCADIYSNCRNFRSGNESFCPQYMAEKIIVLDHLHLADSILLDAARRAINMNLTGMMAEHCECIDRLYREK